jgi:hypothetical protein
MRVGEIWYDESDVGSVTLALVVRVVYHLLFPLDDVGMCKPCKFCLAIHQAEFSCLKTWSALGRGYP